MTYRVFFPPLLALILGLIWIALIPNEPISDQTIYDFQARALAAGKGYIDQSGQPTAYWAPGYAIYLAFFYRYLSPDYIVGYFGNVLIHVVLVLGIYRLGRWLYTETTAFWAALSAAIYPTFLFYNTVLASEILFSALLVWGLCFFWKAVEGEGYAFLWLMLSGLTLGLGNLVRPQALILPLVFPLIGAVQGGKMSRAALLALGCGLFMVLTCLPWGLRNQKELGSFILVSSNFGVNLFMGNHPGATGKYYYKPVQEAIDREDLKSLSLPERDQVFKKKALDYIKSHPWEYLKLVLKRAYITLRVESIAAAWNQIGLVNRFGEGTVKIFKWVTNGTWYGLVAGCLIACYLKLKKREWNRSDLFLIALLGLLAAPFLLIQAQDRFHLPLVPYLMLFACSTQFFTGR